MSKPRPKAPALASWPVGNGPIGTAPQPQYDYTYGKPRWFSHCAEECQAVRKSVALFDQTSFAKYLVEGLRRLQLSQLAEYRRCRCAARQACVLPMAQ